MNGNPAEAGPDGAYDADSAYEAEVTLPSNVSAVEAKLEVVANEEETAVLAVPSNEPVNPPDGPVIVSDPETMTRLPVISRFPKLPESV